MRFPLVPMLIAAAASAPLAARPAAAAAADTLVVQFPEEVVTALRGSEDPRRIPAATFVVPGAELRRRPEARVSSVLQSLPGLYGYRTGATGEPLTVDPRGFTANGERSYLKVLVDGRDARDLENGYVDWDELPAGEVERVEVIEGPGAWIHGDGAQGGIVNIVRREPGAGWEPFASMRAGSHDHFGGLVGLRGAFGPGSLRLSAQGREAEGWRDRSAERGRGAAGALRHVLGDGSTLEFDAAWNESEREDPGALQPDEMAADRTQAESPIDFTDTDRTTFGVAWSRDGIAGGRLRVAPYARRERLEQVRTIFFDASRHRTDGTSVGGEIGWQRELALAGRASRFDAGYQFGRDELETSWDNREFGSFFPNYSGGTSDRLTHSAFAGLRSDLGGGFVARAGVRGDFLTVSFEPRDDGGLNPGPVDDRTMSAVSPFVALSKALGDGASVYASFSGSFQAPTLNQLFDPHVFPSFVPPGFVFLSNGDLDPQRAENFEVGARWDGAGGRRVQATYYYMPVRDEIDFDLSTFQYANLGKSLHQGALLHARWPLGAGFAAEANGTVTPTTIRDGDLDGNQINAVPKGGASGRLSWTPEAPWSLDLGVRWVAKQWLDKENEHPLGEWATVELGGALRWERLRFAARVLNLLDREYADTGYIGAVGEERLVPAAPRTVIVSVAVE